MVGPAVLIMGFGRIELLSFLTALGYGYVVGLWRIAGGSKDGWIAMAVVIMAAAVDDAEERMQRCCTISVGSAYLMQNPQASCIDIDKAKGRGFSTLQKVH